MPDFGGRKPSGGDPSLNEINRSDRFIEALASRQPVYSTDPAEAELAFLLSDWRDSVRGPAPTVPVTARDAVAALNDGLSKRHSRGSLVLVGSAAAAILCIGGFGAAVYGAGPGDGLYGARKALFGAERVSDDAVMLAAQTQMQQVQTLIDQGQWQQAQVKLQELSPTVQSVDTPEHKQQLIQQWNALTYKVVEQNPQATLPPAGEPLPVLPSSPLTLLPVPVLTPAVVTTTSTSTSTSSAEPTSSASPTSTETSTPGTTPTTSATETPTTSVSTSVASSTPTSGSTPTSAPAASTPAASTSVAATSVTPTTQAPTTQAPTTQAPTTQAEAPASVTTTTVVTRAPAGSTAPAPSQTAAVTATVVTPTTTTSTAPTAIPSTRDMPSRSGAGLDSVPTTVPKLPGQR